VHYYRKCIIFHYVLNVLVCILADKGGWPPKHVGGNKKLHCCVYCMCICLCVYCMCICLCVYCMCICLCVYCLCICLYYKEKNQNPFSLSNACVIPRTYEIPIIKIHNNDKSHEKQYKVYFL